MLSEILAFLASWRGIALSLAAILIWAVIRLTVKRASRTRPGQVAIVVLPFLAFALFMWGELDWSLAVALLFAFIVAVLLSSRQVSGGEHEPAGGDDA